MLDPDRLDKALRAFLAHLDYDLHKAYECGEEDGKDHYGELVDMFNGIWEEVEK